MLELSENIKKHFFNPKNTGEIDNPDAMGTINNPVCGDITKLFLRIKEGIIEDAKFLSFGCAVTIASASVFTENIKGMNIYQIFSGADEEIVKRLIDQIETELGDIPSIKLHCPPATVEVFLKASGEYFEKIGRDDLYLKTNNLIAKVSQYYKRGDKEN